MAGYIIHLAIATIAAQSLYPHDEQKRNAFCCGALFPDAFEGEEKNASHYYDFSDEDCVFRKCDLGFFKNSHLQFGSNAFLCGYYVHLLTDQLFYHCYLPEVITVLDKKGNVCQDRTSAKYMRLRLTGDYISFDSFFTDDYLYGDYTKTNADILERYCVKVPSLKKVTFPTCFFGCPSEEVCKEKTGKLLEKLHKLINESGSERGKPIMLDLCSLFRWINVTADRVVTYICPESQKEQSSSGWTLPDILPVWEQKWRQAASSECFFFYNYYLTLYSIIREKADYYHKENFAAKDRFICKVKVLSALNPLMVCTYLVICYFSSAYHLDGAFLLAAEVAYFLFALIVLYPISKKIDIYKYQETWARHRLQAELIEIEMMRFVSELPPYNQTQPTDNCKQFIEAVMKTETKTAELFTHLMTNQEKPLLEELINLSKITES